LISVGTVSSSSFANDLPPLTGWKLFFGGAHRGRTETPKPTPPPIRGLLSLRYRHLRTTKKALQDVVFHAKIVATLDAVQVK